MRNSDFTGIVEGKKVKALQTLFNPYSGGIVIGKGEVAKVTGVQHDCLGNIERITITGGEHSPFSKFSIYSEGHMDLTTIFIVEENKPKMDMPDFLRADICKGDWGKTHPGTIPHALACPTPLMGEGVVRRYITSEYGWVAARLGTNGCCDIRTNSEHTFRKKACYELAALADYAEKHNALP